MDLEPSIRADRRQRRGNQPGAERAKAPAARRARHRRRQSRSPAARAMKFFSGLGERLRTGLQRSRDLLGAELASVFEPDRPIDEALFEELEEVLVAADLG